MHMYTNYIMCIKPVYIIRLCGPPSYHLFLLYILAETPMDYDVVDTILIFKSCDTRACTNMNIVCDNVAEPTEWFSVKLSRTGGLNPSITLNPFVAVIEITANNGEWMNNINN